MLVQCKLEYALIYITVIPIPCHPRLQVVPHLSSGIVERAKGERAGKSPHRVKMSPPRLAFLAIGDFHARSRFARSSISEEKRRTIRSLLTSSLH